jgi:hypothetical protein
MTGSLAPTIFKGFDNQGNPLAAGQLFSYQAGSSTPTPTYTDTTLATPNSNPVILNARGEAAVWLDVSRVYKLVLQDSLGNTIWTLDQIQGVSTPPINQTFIGQTLWPQTAAEQAAAIVPVNFGYTPGDVRRYGAIGDGATDNTVAFQNALNAARFGHGLVTIPSNGLNAQTVYRLGQVTAYEDTLVRAEPGVICDFNNVTTFVTMFNTLSIWAPGVALASNGVAGTTTLTVNSLGSPQLAPGQLVRILDSTYKFGTSGQNLELNQIASVVGTGPYTITLSHEMIGNYATASSATIQPATTAARHIRFEGITVRIGPAADGGGFLISDSYECDLLNCIVIGPKSQSGLVFWRSAYCHAVNLQARDAQSPSTPGYGYGVSMGASTHDCIVYDSTFRNVRENSLADNVRYSGFISCDATRPVDNGFSTHGLGATDCFFINCRSYWSQSKGFVSYSQSTGAADTRIRFQNCISFGSQYSGFFCACFSGLPAVDLEFIDCASLAAGQSVGSSYGWDIEYATRPKLINCRVDGTGSTPADLRAGIYVIHGTDVVIRGGDIYNVSAGYGIIHDTCTNVTIEGVRFQGMGGGQTVHSTGAASTGVTVRGCRSDTQSFDKNSADVFDGNLWNGVLDNTPHARVVLPYTASITPAGWLGDFFDITATNNTAFTINNPSNPYDGAQMTFTIHNTSGGALGVVTMGAAFHLQGGGATLTPTPATANSRSWTFRYDGTRAVWDEIYRTASDVPN